MKLHALMLAVALAAAGSAFAQASYGTGKAADTQGSTTTTTTTTTKSSETTPMAADMDKAGKAPVKKHHRKVAKKHHHHASKHAAAMHHHRHIASARHHEQHASMHMERHTHMMGAGAMSPTTDVNASSRQQRMDAAYQDWLRLQGRR